MDELKKDLCREAFVDKIKKENFESPTGLKQSLKQHWTGAQGGFWDEFLQERYLDFQSGWNTRATEDELMEALEISTGILLTIDALTNIELPGITKQINTNEDTIKRARGK